MANYNPKSLKAEEFISDAEIRETLAYAEENKNNLPLIEEILEKARPKKTATGYTCAGLTHREASVLLACEIPEVIQKIYAIAEEIKLAFYGNRIVIFAPLYLSNHCINGCTYCLDAHRSAALGAGVTDEEITAAIEVAAAISAFNNFNKAIDLTSDLKTPVR